MFERDDYPAIETNQIVQLSRRQTSTSPTKNDSTMLSRFWVVSIRRVEDHCRGKFDSAETSFVWLPFRCNSRLADDLLILVSLLKYKKLGADLV